MHLGHSVRCSVALLTLLVFSFPGLTGCDGGDAPKTGTTVKDAPLPPDAQKSFEKFYDKNAKSGGGAPAGKAAQNAKPAPAAK